MSFPASLNMMTIAVGVFIITFFISQFGKESVAAYGIATRIEQIALLPMIGMNIAVLSIIAQNKGAKKYDRIRETLKLAIKYSSIIMIFALVILFVSASWIMKFFTNDVAVIGFGVPYLRLASFMLFGYVLLFLADAVYRAYKKPMVPLVFSLFRQIVLPVGLFYLMIYIFNTNIFGIWWSLFGIVWISAIIYTVMVLRLVKKDLA